MFMQRSVAVIAFGFGIVTMAAGGRVLAGHDPGFVVFRPLVYFNTIMGLVYVLAGWRAWRDHRRGRTWAGTIVALNLGALVALAVAYAAGAGVAVRSLGAMSVRTLVWAGLFLVLVRVGRRYASSSARASSDGMEEGWVIRSANDAPVTISAFYAIDHDDIDRLLERFQASKDGSREDVLALYNEFKTRLERHIGWEEDILFPLFERLSGLADNGPTVVMRGEHRQITALLGSIEATLQTGGANVDADESELLEVLSAHNWKEENILYPMIDRQVSSADREEVFARMRVEMASAGPV